VSDSSRAGEILRIFQNRGSRGVWWPGTPEEVVIGAVLTQQTRWENVERALARLKERKLCSIAALHRAAEPKIEDAIRPAGFYRIKTRRIKALASFIIEGFGGIKEMADYPLPELRRMLLDVNGVGAETADGILCFALDKPTLVIDRYTERICGCAGIDERGDRLKSLLESALPDTMTVHREMHAHFVDYGKEYCGKKRCNECGIRKLHA